MNATGFLLVAAGLGIILCIFTLVSGRKDRTRRKHDTDEHAEDNAYFGKGEECELLDIDRRAPGQKQGKGKRADPLRFAPELFEHRAEVMEELEAHGFSWMSHYSSVDCLHDQYGIEVCGIHERDDAKSILNILKRMFPDWKPG